MTTERIVFAFSGDVAPGTAAAADVSAAIAWLQQTQRAEVVTVTVDLGDGREVSDIRRCALASGAVRAHVVDAVEEFARDFVMPALQAGAMSDAALPAGRGLGPPLVAKHLVAIAHVEAATAIACVGNDDDALEQSIRAIDPAIRVIVAVREPGFRKLSPASDEGNRSTPVRPAALLEVRATLLGRSISGDALDEAARQRPDDLYVLTKAPGRTPDAAARVDIEFEHGVPQAINGVAMPLLELITSLQTIAGAHGVGRVASLDGAMARTVSEAPAAVVLHAAHDALQSLVTSVSRRPVALEMASRYAELVDAGLWHSPMREAIDAVVARVQDRVTGTVRLELFKGQCRVIGRSSPYAVVAGALGVGGGAPPPMPSPASASSTSPRRTADLSLLTES
ncbi:MAG: argininosuccinate synthase domain-containing protein [Acidobacteriota bacterium]